MSQTGEGTSRSEAMLCRMTASQWRTGQVVPTYFVSQRPRRGHYRRLREAVQQVPAYSRIEIVGGGVFHERIVLDKPLEIGVNKQGLGTSAGSSGSTSSSPTTDGAALLVFKSTALTITAEEAFIEGLTVELEASTAAAMGSSHGNPGTRSLRAVTASPATAACTTSVLIRSGRPTLQRCTLQAVEVGGKACPIIRECSIVDGPMHGLVVTDHAGGQYVKNTIAGHGGCSVLVDSLGAPVFSYNEIVSSRLGLVTVREPEDDEPSASLGYVAPQFLLNRVSDEAAVRGGGGGSGALDAADRMRQAGAESSLPAYQLEAMRVKEAGMTARLVPALRDLGGGGGGSGGGPAGTSSSVVADLLGGTDKDGAPVLTYKALAPYCTAAGSGQVPHRYAFQVCGPRARPVLTRNAIVSCQQHGLLLEGGGGGTYEGNYIAANKGWGVVLVDVRVAPGGDSDHAVSGSSSSHHSGGGLGAAAPTDPARRRSTRMSTALGHDTTPSSAAVAVSGPLFTGNHVSGNGGGGVRIVRSAAEFTEGNLLTHNRGPQLLLEDGHRRFRFAGNKVSAGAGRASTAATDADSNGGGSAGSSGAAAAWAGVWCTGAGCGGEFTSNEFEGCGVGVWLERLAHPTFTLNSFDGGGIGVCSGTGACGAFVSCTFSDLARAAVVLLSASNASFSRCRTNACGVGALVTHGGRGVFDRCEFRESKWVAVEVSHNASPTVHECRLLQGAADGLRVVHGGRGSYARNTMAGSALAQVRVSHGGDPVLEENVIGFSPADGVVVEHGGLGTCVGNVVRSCYGAGIAVSGADSAPVVRGNAISACGGCGLSITEATGGVYEGNILFGHEKVCVWVAGGTAAAAEASEATTVAGASGTHGGTPTADERRRTTATTPETAARSSAEKAVVTLRENIIRGATVTGVSVEHGARLLLVGNCITQHGQTAVNLRGASILYAVRNEISCCPHGVVLDEASRLFLFGNTLRGIYHGAALSSHDAAQCEAAWNVFVACRTAASLRGVPSGCLSHNVVTHAVEDAMQLGAGCAMTITRNVLHDNARGVQLEEGRCRAHFVDNCLRSHPTHAIQVLCGRATASGEALSGMRCHTNTIVGNHTGLHIVPPAAAPSVSTLTAKAATSQPRSSPAASSPFAYNLILNCRHGIVAAAAARGHGGGGGGAAGAAAPTSSRSHRHTTRTAPRPARDRLAPQEATSTSRGPSVESVTTSAARPHASFVALHLAYDYVSCCSQGVVIAGAPTSDDDDNASSAVHTPPHHSTGLAIVRLDRCLVTGNDLGITTTTTTTASGSTTSCTPNPAPTTIVVQARACLVANSACVGLLARTVAAVTPPSGTQHADNYPTSTTSTSDSANAKAATTTTTTTTTTATSDDTDEGNVYEDCLFFKNLVNVAAVAGAAPRLTRCVLEAPVTFSCYAAGARTTPHFIRCLVSARAATSAVGADATGKGAARALGRGLASDRPLPQTTVTKERTLRFKANDEASAMAKLNETPARTRAWVAYAVEDVDLGVEDTTSVAERVERVLSLAASSLQALTDRRRASAQAEAPAPPPPHPLLAQLHDGGAAEALRRLPSLWLDLHTEPPVPLTATLDSHPAAPTEAPILPRRSAVLWPANLKARAAAETEAAAGEPAGVVVGGPGGPFLLHRTAAGAAARGLVTVAEGVALPPPGERAEPGMAYSCSGAWLDDGAHAIFDHCYLGEHCHLGTTGFRCVGVEAEGTASRRATLGPREVAAGHEHSESAVTRTRPPRREAASRHTSLHPANTGAGNEETQEGGSGFFPSPPLPLREVAALDAGLALLLQMGSPCYWRHLSPSQHTHLFTSGPFFGAPAAAAAASTTTNSADAQASTAAAAGVTLTRRNWGDGDTTLLFQNVASTVTEAVAGFAVLAQRGARGVFHACLLERNVHAAGISQGARTAFHNCTFQQQTRAAVRFDSGAEGLVKGCVFREARSRPILVNGLHTCPRLDDNDFIESTFTAMELQHGCAPYVTRNRLRGIHADAVVVRLGAWPVLERNRFDSCRVGVHIQAGGGGRIVGNTFAASLECGVKVTHTDLAAGIAWVAGGVSRASQRLPSDASVSLSQSTASGRGRDGEGVSGDGRGKPKSAKPKRGHHRSEAKGLHKERGGASAAGPQRERRGRQTPSLAPQPEPLRVTNVTAPVLEHNSMTGSKQSGLVVVGEGAAPQVLHNTFADNTTGISLAEGAQGVYQENSLSRHQTALHVDNSAGVFALNVVKESYLVGAELSGSASAPVLAGNIIANGRLTGVVVKGGGAGQLVRNVLQANGGDGCVIDGPGTQPLLFGNALADNGGVGAKVGAGARPSLCGNAVLRNQRGGLVMEGEGTAPLLQGNYVKGNRLVGVLFGAKAGGLLDGGTVTATQRGPAVVVGDQTHPILRDTVVTANAYGGVVVEAGGSCDVLRCVFLRNVGEGAEGGPNAGAAAAASAVAAAFHQASSEATPATRLVGCFFGENSLSFNCEAGASAELTACAFVSTNAGGGGSNAGSGGCALRLGKDSSPTLRHCLISGGRCGVMDLGSSARWSRAMFMEVTCAIDVQGGGSSYYECEMRGCGTGARVAQGHPSFIGCTFSGSTKAGLHITDEGQPTAEECGFLRSTRGVLAEGADSAGRLYNNRLLWNTDNVVIGDGSAVTLERNLIYDAENCGILVRGGRPRILNNEIFDNRSESVSVATGAVVLLGARLEGNTISFAREDGALVVRANSEGAKAFTTSGNTVRNSYSPPPNSLVAHVTERQLGYRRMESDLERTANGYTSLRRCLEDVVVVAVARASALLAFAVGDASVAAALAKGANSVLPPAGNHAGSEEDTVSWLLGEADSDAVYPLAQDPLRHRLERVSGSNSSTEPVTTAAAAATACLGNNDGTLLACLGALRATGAAVDTRMLGDGAVGNHEEAAARAMTSESSPLGAHVKDPGATTPASQYTTDDRSERSSILSSAGTETGAPLPARPSPWSFLGAVSTAPCQSYTLLYATKLSLARLLDSLLPASSGGGGTATSAPALTTAHSYANLLHRPHQQTAAVALTGDEALATLLHGAATTGYGSSAPGTTSTATAAAMLSRTAKMETALASRQPPPPPPPPPPMLLPAVSGRKRRSTTRQDSVTSRSSASVVSGAARRRSGSRGTAVSSALPGVTAAATRKGASPATAQGSPRRGQRRAAKGKRRKRSVSLPAAQPLQSPSTIPSLPSVSPKYLTTGAS